MADKKNDQKGKAASAAPAGKKAPAKKAAAKKAAPAAKAPAAKKARSAKSAGKLTAAQMGKALRGTWLQQVLGNVSAADRARLLNQLARQGFDLTLKFNLTQLVDNSPAATQARLAALAAVLEVLAANPDLLNATDIGIFCSYPCPA